jgi:hypothetical protein
VAKTISHAAAITRPMPRGHPGQKNFTLFLSFGYLLKFAANFCKCSPSHLSTDRRRSDRNFFLENDLSVDTGEGPVHKGKQLEFFFERHKVPVYDDFQFIPPLFSYLIHEFWSKHPVFFWQSFPKPHCSSLVPQAKYFLVVGRGVPGMRIYRTR